MNAPHCRYSEQHGASASRKINKKHRMNNLSGSNATEINNPNIK